ncbi:helix-turn-helix domain-containing protein [Rhodococcus sp. NPDC003318]|uniref:helix-turn-helix domain-containing protein n=1 Tax=Rhodococcus sp. NPDC003318 TaxID=3364503 RepID=UPI0036CEEC0B
MEVLALKVAALDPEAGAAVAVIRHFDSLLESGAGLHSIVRTAAALAECPVRLVDSPRGMVVRALSSGLAESPAEEPQPTWPSAEVTAEGARMWLEHPGPPGTVHAVILERAAGAARGVLARTRGTTGRCDPASIELLLDAAAPEADRVRIARRIGLSGRACVVLAAGAPAQVLPEGATIDPGIRAGIGTMVDARDLPASVEAARLALRITAEGTSADPGPRIVRADDLGALTILIRAADAEKERIPDVRTLDQAATAAPWMLATLDAVASADSLREAARSLHVHHSTMQTRLTHAESLVGWGSLRSQPGRTRLQLALVLRRLGRP